jgi:hypothetical protein
MQRLVLHSDALATAAPASSASACRPLQPPSTAITTIAVATTAIAISAAPLALTAPTLIAERRPPLLECVRAWRPLPNVLWRSRCLLQARPSLGRSRLWLRREGM